MASKYLISVVGPTGIGKTRLAIELAQRFNTEIISADSRQFFKEMTIGTAVPSGYELQQATHHFIQHKSIFEPYSVGDFEREAIDLLNQLFRQHSVVVMVGGSGLYVDAITNGLDNFPEVPSAIRQEINQSYEEKGIEYLQKLLSELDPKHFTKVDIQNPQRVKRALEVCLASGKPYSSFLNRQNVVREFNTITVGLTAERSEVYKRINTRVDLMMQNGLMVEAQRLYPYKEMNALQTVGYRELFDFLEGKFSLEMAVEEIKKNTRRFAKRQFTWFKRKSETLWFDFQEDTSVIKNRIEKLMQ